MKRLVVAVALAVILTACGGGADRVIIAAGTTVVDSGLIDHVAASFEETHPGIQISVVAEPTRLALELGRGGAADITITHAPAQERDLIESGLVEESGPVFSSRFVLVGPVSLSPSLSGLELPEALREIAGAGQAFASRGDGSGTHDKELENWLESGISPVGKPWYLETGQGMGPTLLVADQREAVTLAELGAYLAARGTVSIEDLGVDRDGLENPYTAIVMAGSEELGSAVLFYRWLTSAEGAAAIELANRELFGQIVYRP